MKSICISKDIIEFNNNVDSCIGTGRIGLALTEEYMKQLRYVQEEIGFKFIRGHGLFSDDMAIYQEYEVRMSDGTEIREWEKKNLKEGEKTEKRVEYNFTYVDRVFDQFLQVGIRPYLELGFMPYKLASGDQTIFYWKGNTTPPRDYDAWCDMVCALLRHLLDRYGEEEVLNWPIEVWNEPNLPGFWYKADMPEYFKLFHRTFDAIKKVDKRFKVAGPAVCGGSDKEWISGFMKYCSENNLKPDNVSRHHYTVELPDRVGHYDYHKLMKAEDGFDNLMSSREIIDSYEEYKGMPIHITEFNSSYSPKGVIHDTNLNAAVLARQLSKLGDYSELYSYWTFGDVFEEQGVPFTPFHGGFGLVANGGIPKPTFYAFKFFKNLKKFGGICRHRDENSIVLENSGRFAGVLWKVEENRENTESDTVKLSFLKSANKTENKYVLVAYTVDEETCNPLKVWHEIGEPANPSNAEITLLKDAAKPLVTTRLLDAKEVEAGFEIEIKRNAVIYFELKPVEIKPDRGYSYDRVLEFK